jgi:FkbM family methyltransferase
MTPLTADHVRWAYRLLLDRDVESEDAIQTKLRAWKTTQELRTDIMASEEFGLKNPEHASSRGATIVIKTLADGTRLFVDLADHVIGRPIVRDAYERNEVMLATSLLRAGDVAIDIGAHIGFFTMQLAKAVGPTGHVYAFEPLPRNGELLRQSIDENGFADRVTLEHKAVSNQTGHGTLRFALDSINTGGAFLSDTAVEGLEGLSARAIATVSLDAYPLRRPIRLIKIDVEGAEPAVIAGGASLIARDKPTVVSEVHPEQLARVSHCTPADFFSQLAALGLHAHRIEDGSIGTPVQAADVTGVVTLAFTSL